MRVPLSWLKEFVQTEKKSTDEISDILTMTGLEVEGVEPAPLRFQNVIIGKVRSTEPHPNADSLCVAKVFDGKNELQIVCGAPNCREGLTVAVAPIGARLIEEDGKVFKIKKSKLRDVESQGMLCSEQELGLSDSHEGIMELSDSLAAGTSLESLYGDSIFDIALTPNLAHCSSVTGVARELAAADSQFFKQPEAAGLSESGAPISEQTRVSVEDSEKCPRYACRLIRGVKVGPSPSHIQRRLEACGVRSVNNVVDATNYILMECGHPLHAFDFSTLAEGRIVVKTAKDGDSFTTLDGIERSLSSETLMICDGKGPVAIAGIMGGSNSEVSETTVDVLLESAYFKPTNIRRTSKKLQVQTEASKRFERGCDPRNVLFALDRATALIQKLAGGEIATGYIDEKESDFPEETVQCRFPRINAILGTNLALGEVEDIFSKLGFSYTLDEQNTFTITVPSYRVDITLEIDLIEEVARIYGFDNIAKQESQIRHQGSVLPDTPIYTFERQVKNRLRSEGLQEMMTCDLISPQLAQLGDLAADAETLVKVSNPTSVEQSVLRPSLLPGLLHVVKYNIDHYCPDASSFETGRVHLKIEGDFKEQSAAAILLTGRHAPQHWENKGREVDFFDLKGHVENLLSGFDIATARFASSQRSFFHPGRQAQILGGDMVLGVIGEVHPDVLRQVGIEQRVFLAELNLHELFKVKVDGKTMADLAQFPGSDRDWTLTVTEATPVEDVLHAIRSCPSKLLVDTRLLDVYRSNELGSERKNLTLRFVYQSAKKTLSQEAVEREHGRIELQTREKLGGAVLS